MRPFFLLWVTLLLGYTLPLMASESQDVDAFESVLKQLPTTKLRKLPGLVSELETLADKRSLLVFESMLEGNLYFLRSGKQVVVLDSGELSSEKFSATNAVDGEIIDGLSKGKVKKVRVNNRIRKQLRVAISRLNLFSDDQAKRLEAVDSLLNRLDEGSVDLLKKAKMIEKDPAIIKQIDIAIAISYLSSDDREEKKQAIISLSGKLQPIVKNRLTLFLAKDESGEYLEKDSALVSLAKTSIDRIDERLAFYEFMERLFFGLSLGSVLLLAAIGLAITFGVMGVINMAHGELLMLGAYTTYVIQQLMPNHVGLSIFVSIPAAFLVCALVGVAIERGIIQFLKGRPLETLLATFGLSLILQQAVRAVFSPLNRQVISPEWMSGAWQINPGFALTYNRLYILIFSLLVFFLLLIVMKKTALGLYVRAVSQNRNMAKAVGIRSEWVDAMTFGLGSGVAGVAGVALSQLTNVGPNLGQAYIIDSFMVVVFGGVGNLWGTLVGAFTLGITSKFLEPITGAMLAQIFVLIFIVLFIQKRPRGLFPEKGRAAE